MAITLQSHYEGERVLNKAATLTASSGLSNTAIVTGITNVGSGISIEVSGGRKLQPAPTGSAETRSLFCFFRDFNAVIGPNTVLISKKPSPCPHQSVDFIPQYII